MNTETQVLNVPIEDIIPNRFQPRLHFDEAGLNELASSIKEHGIIQPLVLRRLNDKYEIVAGERRYKAAKIAGLTFVPAIISNLDDKNSAEIAIVENIQRKDLTSIEEAKSYKALLDKGYLTQDELAKKMGLSQSAISNKLRLLTLSENVQKALMEGQISERHARSLLKLPTEEEQDEWLKKVIEERITVRELDKKLKENNKEDISEVAPTTDEVPIIPKIQDIDAIKEKATDIVVPQVAEQKQERIIKENPIPNKFFNYLEDEEANMSLVEPAIEEEEIELLDVDIPVSNLAANEEAINSPETTTSEQNFEFRENKDLTKANELIDTLLADLQSEKYDVVLDKDDTNDKIKYIITVNKNE